MYRWAKRIIIALAVIIGFGLLWWQMNDQQQAIRLHGYTYHMTIMRTSDELQRGLSDTQGLASDHAMLFVFPSNDTWPIWMKDMNYPIDIVWLDSDRNVVYMAKDAKPSSYPDTQFKPDKNARYVIELSSGTIERTGIKIGDPAGLPSGV